MDGILDVREGPTGTLLQRNFWWSMLFTQLLVLHQDLRDQFPDIVEVIILPEDDPELTAHNLTLANQRRGHAPPVLVRVSVTGNAGVNVQPWRADSPAYYALA